MNLLKQVKEAGQDEEWYPSTPEMLACINRDLKLKFHSSEYNRTTEQNEWTNSSANILDCGSGDGRALKALSHGGQMFAIEKSKLLIDSMDSNIFPVGSDFYQTTLIDKKVDVIFCNPPYSEFEQWAVKIIKEANCESIYLIIPERWKASVEIAESIKARSFKHKVIGSFDFLKAERVARAKVDIVKIYRERICRNDDPFSLWFDDNFKLARSTRIFSSGASSEKSATFKEKVNELVNGRNLISILVDLYSKEMAELQKNYKAVCQLDSGILDELDVNVDGLKESLKQRITGLKSKYWKEFFDHYEVITNRLTKKSREKMLEKLHGNMSVDFNSENAYSITSWAIKNANKYYDSQFIETVESMVSMANTTLYKSNERLYLKEDWRNIGYRYRTTEVEKYSLELRIVLYHSGGIYGGGFSYDDRSGLQCRAHDFLNDLLTIAENLRILKFAKDGRPRMGSRKDSKIHPAQWQNFNGGQSS